MTDLLPIQLTQEVGPAMSALNPQQQAFVRNLATNGGNATRAYIDAGYTVSSPEAGRVGGHRLAHNPKVLLAIREDAESRMHAGAGMAADVMITVMRDATHKDRYKAAAHVLALAGISPTIKHEHLIEPSRSAKELLQEIRDMAKVLKLDAGKLLGEVTDAEFEDVTPDGRAGLEDML